MPQGLLLGIYGLRHKAVGDMSETPYWRNLLIEIRLLIRELSNLEYMPGGTEAGCRELARIHRTFTTELDDKIAELRLWFRDNDTPDVDEKTYSTIDRFLELQDTIDDIKRRRADAGDDNSEAEDSVEEEDSSLDYDEDSDSEARDLADAEEQRDDLMKTWDDIGDDDDDGDDDDEW